MEFEHERIDCPACGMIMMLPKNFIDIKRHSGREFYCAAGHTMQFDQKSTVALQSKIDDMDKEIARLKRDNARLIHKLDQAGVS